MTYWQRVEKVQRVLCGHRSPGMLDAITILLIAWQENRGR